MLQAIPTVHNEGARRFGARYLSRNSIRLSRKHRRVSNHFDVILTLSLETFATSYHKHRLTYLQTEVRARLLEQYTRVELVTNPWQGLILPLN